MVTGVRGLCNGLGPAVYGVIFYIFNVKVDEGAMDLSGATEAVEGDEPGQAQLDPAPELDPPLVDSSILPGPPFLFGACSVVLGTCYTVSTIANPLVIHRKSFLTRRCCVTGESVNDCSPLTASIKK